MPRDIITIRRRGGYFTAVAAGGGAITAPTDITGCVLWLDAADASKVHVTGSSVNSWDDKSGQNNNFTSITGTATLLQYNTSGGLQLNSKNTVTFTDTQGQYLASTGTWPAGSDVTAGATMFMVLRPTSNGTGGNYRGWFDWTGTNRPLVLFVAADNDATVPRRNHLLVTTWNSGGTTFDASPTNVVDITPTWRMDMARVNPGVDVTLLSNSQSIGAGPTAVTGSLSSQTGNTVSIGALQGPSSYVNGDMAEVILYKSALSSGDQTSVWNYLSAKWGISLAAGTP